MGFWENFPYTNFHDMNLSWILVEIKKLRTYIENYTAINKVAYSGIWSITSQYPQWAVVSTGNKTYLSKIPVPIGIEITNEKYWIELADLDPRIGSIIARLENFNIVNVKDFGAVGDGSANDSEAFSNALSSGAKFVLVPQGLYNCSEITIPENCEIVGLNATIFSENNDIFTMQAHSKIRGITIEDRSNGGCTCINVLGDGVYIDNCTFNYKGIALALRKNYHTVNGCNFSGANDGVYSEFGVWIDDPQISENIKIVNNTFSGCKLNAIFGRGKDLLIANNTFNNNHLQTAPTGGGHIAIKHDVDNLNSVLITGNTFNGGNSATSGVECDGENVTISNNVFTNIPAYAVVFQTGDNNAFCNNAVNGCAQMAVIAKNGNIVSGNICTNVQYAFTFGENPEALISNNTLQADNFSTNPYSVKPRVKFANNIGVKCYNFTAALALGETMEINPPGNATIRIFYANSSAYADIYINTDALNCAVITDPYDFAASTDTENKLCLYYNGNTLTLKNNRGGTAYVEGVYLF